MGLLHLAGGFGLDPEMVDGAPVAGILEQHQLERRLVDREVGVPVAALGRFGIEEPRVVVDCFVDVIHIECQLQPHGFTLRRAPRAAKDDPGHLNRVLRCI